MSALHADGVTCGFGSLVAVDDVSLAVEAGEVVGLVGPNGAGKTTLIRALLGLVVPTSGSVELAGGAPSRTTRARVGYVPQSMGLWEDLTVAEHRRLVVAAFGTGATDGRGDLVGDGVVPDDTLVGHLPLGLRRRLSFDLARSHRPAVLVLDEPTSGVDPLARSRLWDAIHAAADDGAAVLVSTHYLDEAARCDRVVLLADGRVVASGTVADLVAERRAVEVRASRWQDAWHRLVEAGLPVLPSGRALRVAGTDAADVRRALGDVPADVATVPATLEEVFLTVTAA